MTITKAKRDVPAQRVEVWTVAEAKAHFSDLVGKAKSQGPQTITRHGKLTAVVVSAEDWKRRQRKGSLAEFLSDSPLAGSALHVERSSDAPRKIRL